MKSFLSWALKVTGIYQYVWNDFCDKYPIRLSADTPEVKKYLETQSKVFTDTMIYGMGCTQYVDPRSIGLEKPVVH